MLVERKSLFSDTNVTKLISRLKFTKKSLMTAFTTNSGQVQYSRTMSYKLRTIFFLKRGAAQGYTFLCPIPVHVLRIESVMTTHWHLLWFFQNRVLVWVLSPLSRGFSCRFVSRKQLNCHLNFTLRSQKRNRKNVLRCVSETETSLVIN